MSYKALVAQFTANAPQPYGVIPPRKKRTNRSSLVINTTGNSEVSSAMSNKRTSLPPSISPVSATSLELLPTSSMVTSLNNLSTESSNSEKYSDGNDFIQPFFHSLQSLLPESTSSSSRLGFWANLKAQYLASATSFSWSLPSSNTNSKNGGASLKRSSSDILLPPAALRVANSSPVTAVVDATSLSASSNPSSSLVMTLSDAAIVSLPNFASPSSSSTSPTSPTSTTTVHSYHGSVSYPVSFAAMDKFKVVRSDTIPLKTFTYLETPVVDRPRSESTSVTLHQTKNEATNKTMGTLPPLSSSSSTAANKSGAKSNNKRHSLLPPSAPPLPRHLLARETRSNADYLRMMAAELRMIRSRKLISPLKPRGYLPRRKDPFRYGKSSLCESIVPPREEDDHPLNDVMVGSWSSTNSSDTFLSASSSCGYHTPQEELYQYF
ncbi:hypothetical protein BGZ83_001874 [Gryganskiella cystojenkinii]|nr:hypothetical protein BGZ83_001874 [Gryganskiella cystojenkinii]